MRGTATVRRTTPLANGGMDRVELDPTPVYSPHPAYASSVRPLRPSRMDVSASATEEAAPRWTCWHVSTCGRGAVVVEAMAGSDEDVASVRSRSVSTRETASAETAGASALRVGERSGWRLGAGLAFAARPRARRPSPVLQPDAADARGVNAARIPVALIPTRPAVVSLYPID